MEQLIPRTLRRLGHYQSNLAKSAVFTQFQNMTKGQLSLRIKGDPVLYSFGYGNKVKAEIVIENERFFNRFWNNGELGFGESYVDGDWNSPDLAQVIRWFFLNVDQIDAFVRPDDISSPFMQFMLGMRYIQDAINLARPLGSIETWAAQYDLERPFFALMLDSALHNSGALFAKGDTLDDAQKRKLRRLSRELRIRPGSRILELGCGWGSLALHMAQNYDCHVTAVTLSEEQFVYLQKQTTLQGLEHKITPVHADFRSAQGLYDRIISVELIDTLEGAQLSEFFERCESWLRPQGLMVHQMLLSPDTPQAESNGRVEWQQKYIAPGIATPSVGQLLRAMNEKATFSIRNLKDIGLSYSRTLDAWSHNFDKNREAARELGFDERFIRSWQYYLGHAEAAFDHGLLTAAQITMSRATQRGEEHR